MRQLSYIVLFIFLSPAVSFAASAVMLVNPPTLYFSKPGAVSLTLVQEALVDAVDRSSSPQVIWSIENNKPNLLTVRFIAKGKHTAFLNIIYDENKIKIKYKDSQNLKYEKLNNIIDMIHPNYHIWVNYFVQKIKFSTEKYTKYTLLEKNPVTPSRKKGGQHFIVAAQAEPGKRDDEYELSYTIERFSASLLKRIAKSVDETSEGTVAVQTIPWGDTVKNLLKESRKKEVSKVLCETHKADKILYANAPRMAGGQGSRDITYYLYICSNNRKIKETYEIDRNENDTYGYQVALKYSTRDFIAYK